MIDIWSLGQGMYQKLWKTRSSMGHAHRMPSTILKKKSTLEKFSLYIAVTVISIARSTDLPILQENPREMLQDVEKFHQRV